MNKYLNFAIIAETKEDFNDLKDSRDYNLIKEGSKVSYDNKIICKQLNKYLRTQKESKIKYKCGAIFGKEIEKVYDVFAYSYGRLIKLIVDEKNKTVTKYILYQGSVYREYADINRKFITEEFYIEDGQDSYSRINNYMEFDGNMDTSINRIVNKFLEDVIEINNPYDIIANNEFSNIKIESPKVKEIFKRRDDLKMNIDLYSKVSVNIDEEIKDNKIENFKINLININAATTKC